jgi:REP element-mobilizing transposase RayT
MIFEENSYYHLYNRGCNKNRIFREIRDYQKLLRIIEESKMKDYLQLCAFSLMPNHYHFLVKQISIQPISKWVQYIFNRYVKYFNTKYERRGTLFESKVQVKKIDKTEYFEHVTHYIHSNPDTEFLQPYSSLNYLYDGSFINLNFYLELFGSVEQYFKDLILYQKSKNEELVKEYLFHGKK